MRLRFEWLCLTLPLMTVGLFAEDAAKPSEPAAAAREVEAGEIKVSVPSAWKQRQPSNKLRLVQFSILPVPGETESSEYYVAGPIGGSIEANIARWLEMFQKEGREVVMTKGTCPQGEYVMVQLTGTYRLPIGPPILRKTEPAPGYRMQGVVLTVAKDGQAAGNYFVRLTGPKNTVIANEAAFRTSIGADASKEEKYELPSTPE